MNWRNVLPFGVPDTPAEVMASLVSALVVGIVGAVILVSLLIWGST
jgi:hypothetical protein